MKINIALKKLALCVPLMRRLVQQRDRLLADVNRLRGDVARLDQIRRHLNGIIKDLPPSAAQSLRSAKLGTEEIFFPSDWTVCFLATMPRSGTWYSYYVFEFLNSILANATPCMTRQDMTAYPHLKLLKFHVHARCPGFEQEYRGSFFNQWDELPFIENVGFEGHEGLADNLELLSPAKNERVRIVYIARNPLDQIVSISRHIEHHTLRDLFPQFDNPAQYLHRGGIDSFIKQYFTFVAMKELFPDNIMLVKYEDILLEPRREFKRMLDFVGFQMDTPSREEALGKALGMASIDSLKKHETRIGGALGGDQINSSESHMRGGEIGKWRHHLSEKDVETAEKRLRSFGMSLDQFTTTPPK